MRLRVAEINQHAVAHVLGDKAIEPGDDLGDGAVIGGDDLAQILGIERAPTSAVEPTRSQNITVSCRRSASTPTHPSGDPSLTLPRTRGGRWGQLGEG